MDSQPPEQPTGKLEPLDNLKDRSFDVKKLTFGSALPPEVTPVTKPTTEPTPTPTPTETNKPRKPMLDLVSSTDASGTTDNFSDIDLAVTTPDNLADLKQEYAARYEKMFGSNADAATKVKNLIAADIDDVASRLLRIALHSPNERLAADAAKYLLDRTIFRAGTSEDEMERWMAQLAGKVDAVDAPVKPPITRTRKTHSRSSKPTITPVDPASVLDDLDDPAYD